MEYNELNLGQIKALVDLLGGITTVQAILSNEINWRYWEKSVDLNSGSQIPYEGWTVESHKTLESFKWDSLNIEFFIHKMQLAGGMPGTLLKKEIANKRVLNSNLLDYLLDHPYLIPDEWKMDELGNPYFLHFWGTVYRLPDKSLCVRHLFFAGGHWQQGQSCIDKIWGPSAISLVVTI